MCPLNPKYNEAQNVASGISGYEPNETSAQDDYYYDECHTIEQKIEQINNYAFEVYGLKLKSYKAHRIMQFLEKECTNTNELYHAFMELR